MDFHVLLANYKTIPKWTLDFPSRACGQNLVRQFKKQLAVLSQRTLCSAKYIALIQNHSQALSKIIHEAVNNTIYSWNPSLQKNEALYPLAVSLQQCLYNTDTYLWVFFHCCQDSKTFSLSLSLHFSSDLKSPPVFWQYQQMKDATLDPSVNAHKSNKFMCVCPCYSTYTVGRPTDHLKELKKFKTALSVSSLRKNLSKTGKSSILSHFMSIIPLTFNYQVVNILWWGHILNWKGGKLLDSGLQRGVCLFKVAFIVQGFLSGLQLSVRDYISMLFQNMLEAIRIKQSKLAMSFFKSL